MFEQVFKNIDDVLWKDAGCTSELDYTEQSSWLLFLKYLDTLEANKATEAQLAGKPYEHILAKQYRWESWAAPKGKDGKIDHNKAQTGDDLIAFVNDKLFPHLKGFKAKATGPNTIEYKIGEIFGGIKNRIQSGYTLRDVIDHVDELRFASKTEKHELSHLYEAKIKNMGNAGQERRLSLDLLHCHSLIMPRTKSTKPDSSTATIGFEASVPVRKDLANGSMSSNQSGDCPARSASSKPKPKPQSLPRQRDIRRDLIEADLVDCMVALPGQLFYSTLFGKN